jgi:Fe-S-cluster containining protein
VAIPDPTAQATGATALATEIHSAWDQAWPDIERAVANQGLEIVCREGCHGCCFDVKPCARCEGLLIADYLRAEFSPERQDHFRSRVESAMASVRRLRVHGIGEDGNDVAHFGGLECPFLERGRCAIYPVRPLACRSMVFAAPSRSEANTTRCRQCPASVVCLEARMKHAALEASLLEREPATGPRATIAEMLSRLWESDGLAPATDTLTAAT